MAVQGTRGTPEKREPKWWDPFLKALSKSGNVLVACRSANVIRRTAYKHRDRFPSFRKRWEDALEDSTDILEAEARRRAASGVDKPIYYKGERVDTIKEYSDTLLIFLLKAHRPEKFRDNFDVTKLVQQLSALQQPEAPKPPSGGAAGDQQG